MRKMTGKKVNEAKTGSQSLIKLISILGVLTGNERMSNTEMGEETLPQNLQHSRDNG